MNRFCSQCATPLPDSAQFCPNCAAPVAKVPSAGSPEALSAPLPDQDPERVPTEPHPIVLAPPSRPATVREPASSAVTPATPPRPRRGMMWIAIPVVVVLLILGLLAILSGMPFGKKERTVAAPKIAQVKDAEPPPLTGTIRELPAQSPAKPGEAEFTILEPNVSGGVLPAPPPPQPTAGQPQTPQPTQPSPAPVIREEAPVPSSPPPAPRESSGEREISEEEAVATLQGYLDARKVYDLDDSCIGVRSEGYSNEGYTLLVTDRCDGGSIGRWRVDAKNRELYRQRADGKYRRP